MIALPGREPDEVQPPGPRKACLWKKQTRVRQQGKIAMTMFVVSPEPEDGRTIYVSDEHLAGRIQRLLTLSEGTVDG